MDSHVARFLSWHLEQRAKVNALDQNAYLDTLSRGHQTDAFIAEARTAIELPRHYLEPRGVRAGPEGSV